MEKLKEVTEKLRQRRQKKGQKDKMNHPQGWSWALVDKDGNTIPLRELSQTVGKQNCDILPQGDGIEVQHAVIKYDTSKNNFQIKDLGSSLGTYVNGSRIPAEEDVTLNSMDSIYFGKMYHIHQNMEESQQDTKFTSNSQELLQMNRDKNMSHVAESHQGSVTSTNNTDSHYTDIQLNSQDNTKVSSKASMILKPEKSHKYENITVEKKVVPKEQKSVPSERKEVEEQIPVWASRHTHHIMAECPGCIAEQEIKHTCGGHDDADVPLPVHSVAHNHPVHAPPRGSQAHSSWEEPPLHYHRPLHYPPVDYRGYPPPSAQANFDDKDYIYSTNSHSFAPPMQYGAERRSHEASESQMKRSKSAHFQYESQGFTPYSREAYHYPYGHPPPPSGYPSHAFHPHSHLHGYYPPAGPPPPLYSHYLSQPRKAMYHGCKTCISLMNEYGHVPRDHLYYHEVSARQLDISNSNMAYQSSPPSSSPKGQASVEPSDSIDISPSDQGYVSQSEKMDISDSLTTAEIHSSSVKDELPDILDNVTEDENIKENMCTVDTSVSSDIPVSSTSNPDISVFTNTAQVTLSSMNDTTVKVSEESSITSTSTSVTSSSHIEDSSVDIIPERDTNPSDVLPARTDHNRIGSEFNNSTPLYGKPSWWGEIKQRKFCADSENENAAERPNNIDLINACDGQVTTSHISTVISITKSVDDPTHTPPERDPGLNTASSSLSKQLITSNKTEVAGVNEISLDNEHYVNQTNICTTVSSYSNNTEIHPKCDPPSKASDEVLTEKDSPSEYSTNASTMNGRTVIVPERTVIMAGQKYCPPPPRMTDVVMIGKPSQQAQTKTKDLQTPEAFTDDNRTDDARSTKKASSMAFTIDLGDETPAKPQPSANNTSFTVDMGQDDKNKSVTQSDSLSNFLPQKLRKSFQGRAPKAKTEKEAKHEKAPGNESDSNPYRSPVSKRRAKGTTPKMGRRTTGYHSDGGHSALSSDNEENSISSEIIQRGSTRKSLPAKPVTTPRGTGTRTRTRNTESTHARTARVLEAMSVEKKLEKRLLRSVSAGLHKANPADMFMYSMEHSDEQNSPVHEIKKPGEEPPSEYVLYKESKHYDTMIKSKSMHSIKGKKDNGETKKKARISTSSRSLTVPQCDDDGDDISEAGTYTIEVDQDVKNARQSIDQIFNVPDRLESLRMVPRRPAVQKQPAIDNNSTDTDINGNVEDVRDVELSKPRGSLDNDSIENECDQKADDEVWHSAVEKQHNNYEDRGIVTVIEPGVIPHIDHHSPILNHNKPELSRSPETNINQQTSSTSPASSHTRRRRKLPTPPIRHQSEGNFLSSPRTPQTSSLEPQLDQDSPGRHRGTLSYSDTDKGFGFTVSFDAPQSHSQDLPSDKEMVTPRTDDESLVSGMFSATSNNPSNQYDHSYIDSARSTGSMDTQVLLQDTEQVMRVLEERVEKRLHARNDSLDDEYDLNTNRYSPVAKEDLFLKLNNDSDSDTSSTCAVVGETPKQVDQRSKPDIYKPDNKRINKHKPSSIIRDKAMNHIGGRSGKKLSNSSADFEVFGVTDESGNESGSIASTSTDYSLSNISGASPKLQRKGSAGKGSIANTRTNRTFALRRSKADGSDGETSKTDISSARSSRKSMSEKSTPRTSSRTRPSSAKETTRTDASLGQQIVQKSRDNMKVPSKDPKDKSLTRKDGGRFSLRSSKSQSVSSTSDTRSRSKTEVTTPRSGRSSGGLSVTGSTPKSSQSTKSTNKTEEYKAWQRRHKYDPRKAVADAKAKEKRARSVGNTPEFADTTRPRGDTMDSVSSEDSGHLDEITRLSSMVASDLNLMTHKHETQAYTEVRSSAFTSVSTHSNGSAFKSPAKTKNASPLYSPVPIKAKPSIQYDPVLLSSIQQLSLQLKSQANRILIKLGERRGVESGPVDELHCETVEDASPELSQALTNLRNTEHVLKVLEKEMFFDYEDNTHQELERIHNEMTGFRPIPQARPSKQPTQSSKKSSISSSKSRKSSSKLTYSQESVGSYAGTEYY